MPSSLRLAAIPHPRKPFWFYLPAKALAATFLLPVKLPDLWSHRSAQRDRIPGGYYREEQRQWEALLAACPALAAQAQGDAASFPSPVEALEALLQLEDQVAENRVVLHWPQGQSLRLAGRASAS
ncbi:MAG: hypothetical protein NTY19_41595 [Planctomycetota bacterium]|nr:hypothetical protein [Planctomycetota bacterium]